jgi:hypothetical protein
MLKIFFRRTLLLYTVHSAECLSNQIAAETELWKRWLGATSLQVLRTGLRGGGQELLLLKFLEQS